MPLTPLEQSRADTGRRFFLCDPSTYSQMAAGVDQIRQYPHGKGSKAVTERGLSPVAALPLANDGSGKVLISLERWRFTPSDDSMIQPAIDVGLITEINATTYDDLKPLEES